MGLRFDHSRATSQDLPEIDAQGNETGGTVEGRGTLYTWNVLSPRLGMTLKLPGDGKTILRAHYGRYHQGVLTGDLSAVHPGRATSTTARFDPATGGYTTVVSVLDPRANVRVDPGTRSPSTDHLSVGIDRELAKNMSIGATYVHKQGRDFLGWTDVGGIYGTQTVSLADGRSLEVFPLLNSPSERRFVLTNPEAFYLRYNGVLLSFQRRWSRGWQALVSYSNSQATGLQIWSLGGASSAQSSATLGSTLGTDPNALIHATGKLPDDRTHMFRVQGSVEMPKGGVLVSANFQHLTGKPWSARTLQKLPQGTQSIFVEPRGSRRFASQTLFDLRVSKVFRFGRRASIEILTDVLNVLNETAEEGIVTDNVSSPNFAVPNVFVDPPCLVLKWRSEEKPCFIPICAGVIPRLARESTALPGPINLAKGFPEQGAGANSGSLRRQRRVVPK